MNINEIIKAFRVDEVESDIPFHFIAIDNDDGSIANIGKSFSIEDEIFMLSLHMEAVRTVISRHSKELGVGDIDFSDPKEWLSFLILLYAGTIENPAFKGMFDMSEAKSTVTKIHLPKKRGEQDE